MRNYKNLIKISYSKNGKLKKLTDKNFLLSIGYPQKYVDFYKSFSNVFPVAYPFLNINLRNKKILDIGCGSGFDAFCAINEEADTVIGIDISFTALKNHNLNNKFFKICADIDEGFPIKKLKFDIILFNGSFNQIIKKFSVLKNLKTFLKKDGIIIICDLLWCGDKEEKKIYYNDIDTWIVNIGGSLTEKNIWNIVKSVNYKIIEFKVLEEIYPIKRFKVVLKK